MTAPRSAAQRHVSKAMKSEIRPLHAAGDAAARRPYPAPADFVQSCQVDV